jgi:hypothetical protein
LNKRLRARLPAQRRRDLVIRDLSEAMQLGLPGFAPRPKRDKAAPPPPAAPAPQELPGRLSGPAEWRAARGEAGAGGAGAGAPGHHPAPPPPGTRYELAGPGHAALGPLFASAGRVFSLPRGAWRASGQNGQAEAAGRLFDGEAATKWLDFGGGGPGGQSWVEFRLPSTAEPVVVTNYSLVAAGDAPERDPAHVLLECVPALDAGCSGDGGGAASEAWVPLDERRGVKFTGRGGALNFTVPAAARAPARRWRLRVLAAADPAAANSVQLAGWDLYAAPGAPAAAPAAGAALGRKGGPQESNGGGTGGEAGGEVLYLTEAARAELRALAEAEDAAAAPPGAPLPLLRRIAGNVLVEPAEAKFFQLRGDKVGGPGTGGRGSEAARCLRSRRWRPPDADALTPPWPPPSQQLGALLSRPGCVAALLAMGFRPALLPPRPGAPSGGAGDAARVGLVADHSDGAASGSDGAAAARRGAAAVLGLVGGGGGGKGGGGGAAGAAS